MFVDATKIYDFKAKDSEIERYPLCLSTNIVKIFTTDNMRKKIETGLKGSVSFFFVGYRSMY